MLHETLPVGVVVLLVPFVVAPVVGAWSDGYFGASGGSCRISLAAVFEVRVLVALGGAVSKTGSLGLACHGRQPVVGLGYAVGLVFPSGFNPEGLELDKLIFDLVIGHFVRSDLKWKTWLPVELAIVIVFFPLVHHVLGNGALFFLDPFFALEETVCRTIEEE